MGKVKPPVEAQSVRGQPEPGNQGQVAKHQQAAKDFSVAVEQFGCLRAVEKGQGSSATVDPLRGRRVPGSPAQCRLNSAGSVRALRVYVDGILQFVQETR